jgi:hypothetical protein
VTSARFVLVLGTVVLIGVLGAGLWNDLRVRDEIAEKEEVWSQVGFGRDWECQVSLRCGDDNPDELRDEREAYRLWFGFAGLATVLLTGALAFASRRPSGNG